MEMKVVTFGEIMMRLSPPGFQRYVQARSFNVVYGGAEANVAVSLANFGVPVDYVTRLPENDLGDACLNYLRQFGVNTDKIIRGGDRLGIYFNEMGAVQRGNKVIYVADLKFQLLHELSTSIQNMFKVGRFAGESAAVSRIEFPISSPKIRRV